MNEASSRPVVERLAIAGPMGNLEGILETPLDADDARVAIVCHPHPVYGGTMTNKVVHMLAKAFNDLSVRTIRFNYRGVGASVGTYDEGRGETLDTLAVVRWANLRWPDAKIWLGGFSFGGAVALRTAAQIQPARLVTVAPAIQRVDVTSVKLRDCPWLIVQGDNDELVNAQDVQAWAESLEPRPQFALLSGVDHFFHGRLNELRDVVTRWVEATKLDG
ncbi:MAG TPA: alpha/beta fold hydrolase [Steroidobacteraceae bacterium]|nr:alpha/beta fold hydrolase [Steroidobacteraceae bacterium]